MNIYNVKAALRDTFYGEPSVLYGTPKQDARALASLSSGTVRVRATNGRHYWYFFVKDIKNRDLIRFLMRRNGLRPEFHMSHYYAAPQATFRVHMSDLIANKYLDDFAGQISAEYSEDGTIVTEMARYLDTIKTKLDACKIKNR